MNHPLADDLHVQAMRQDLERALRDPHRAALREWRRHRALEQRAARRRTLERLGARIRGALAGLRPRPT
jgi:hypothetical protein